MGKFNKKYIFELADRDVNTGSYPYRGMWSNGQKEILNGEEGKSLKSLSIKLKTLKAEKGEKLEEMRSKEPLFNEEKKAIQDNDRQIKKETEDLTFQINNLEIEIEKENKLRTNRGFKPIQVEIKNAIENGENKKIYNRMKVRFHKIKNTLLTMFVFCILEVFFAFALYDRLIETKSLLQIILRVASSGLLFACLEHAYIRHNVRKDFMYGLYILYGWLSLVAGFFGFIFFELFYPEMISSDVTLTYNLDLDLDLDSSITDATIETSKSLGSIFIDNDYLIGFFGLLVYVLIYFLDRNHNKIKEDSSSKKEQDEKENYDNKEGIDSSEARIITLYSELTTLNVKLESLKTAQGSRTLTQPTELLNEILKYLESHKKVAKKLKVEIDETESLINGKINEIQAVLDNYEVDFKDIFNDKPAAQIVELEWPEEEDIREYYKI